MERTREKELAWQIEEFMICCKSKDLRRKTMMSYEQTLRLFERWCKEALTLSYVDEITENVVRRYITELQERGKYTYCADEKSKSYNVPERRRDFRQPLSPITINNYLRNLRVFFAWLVEEDVLKTSPMRRIKALKVARNPNGYMSDVDLISLFMDWIKDTLASIEDYAMIILMLDSGMRLGECSTLHVDIVIANIVL